MTKYVHRYSIKRVKTDEHANNMVFNECLNNL